MNSLKLARRINDELSIKYKEKGDFFYKYLNSQGDYTTVFNDLLDKVLTDSSCEAYINTNYEPKKMYYQKEKMTVDSVIWESFYHECGTCIHQNMWKYRMFIEHENNGFSWLHELQKLSSLKSENKLIITYGRIICDENYFEKNSTYKFPEKGVNLLNIANIIVNRTLSFAEKYIIDSEKDKETLNNKLPNFVIMFGADLNELKKTNNELYGSLYDIYQFDYKIGGFVRISNEEN